MHVGLSDKIYNGYFIFVQISPTLSEPYMTLMPSTKMICLSKKETRWKWKSPGMYTSTKSNDACLYLPLMSSVLNLSI